MDTLLSVIDFDYPFCDAREKTMYYHVLYWDYLHREGVFLRPQSEDTGELTTVIDPASITRMASSHPDNRETTMYGRHDKHDGKPPKIKRSRTKTDKPKHPIEQVMLFVMLAVSIVFLAGTVPLLWFMPVSEPEDMIVRPILTGLIGVAAVSADIPAWIYFARWRRNLCKSQI